MQYFFQSNIGEYKPLCASFPQSFATMATGTVGDRGHMNYVFTPTECLILNYPQLLTLSPSQGFLSSSCRTPAIHPQEGLWRPLSPHMVLPATPASLVHLVHFAFSNYYYDYKITFFLPQTYRFTTIDCTFGVAHSGAPGITVNDLNFGHFSV